jgi:hypothetical protein
MRGADLVEDPISLTLLSLGRHQPPTGYPVFESGARLRRRSMQREAILEALGQLGIPREVADDVPVLTAGVSGLSRTP